MPHNLTPHPTWNIQDSSKVQCFMDCPRKYFYQYVLGWDSQEPKPYLVFGEGIHAALEVLMQHGYSIDTGVEAFNAFMAVFERNYPSGSLADSGPALATVYTPGHAFATIGEYLYHYQRDAEVEVLYTELGGSMPIDFGTKDRPMRLLYFRIDGIFRSKEGVLCLEHKTTKKSTNMGPWLSRWDTSFQVGTYTHVVRLLFPNEAKGVDINAIFLAPATKAQVAEGRSTGNEYVRIPQRRTLDMMDVWLWNANRWFDWIEHEFHQLEHCDPSDALLRAFPLNTESCTKYWGCPFRAFCGAWANPLRHAEAPPIGFGTRWWDPQSRAKESKKVVYLGTE